MAAALFRRGPGLCVRCFHRELCRVVWRPQAALFSTKPSDRKPPRRTHIKKAKPQPAVDIAKLLEQLFSQKRPGTAPPAAGKAKPASSKPPTTSSLKVSTSHVPRLSKTEPAVSVSPAASSVSKKAASTSSTASLSPEPKSATSTNPKTLFSSETLQQLPRVVAQDVTSYDVSSVSVPVTSSSPPTSTVPPSLGSEAGTVENQTKVETPTEAALSSAHIVSSIPAVTGEPSIETTKGSTVETSLPIEAQASTFSVAESPVDPLINATVDTPAQKVTNKSKDSGVADTSSSTVEASVETAIEPSADTSISPLGRIDNIAAEGTVEPPVEFEERAVDILNTAEEEASLETVKSPVESVETRASAEGPVASAVDATIPHTATVEPVLETTVDPPTVETLETAVTVAEGAAETTIEAKDSDTATVEPSSESTIEPLVEANTSPLQSQATVEPTIETEGADNVPHVALVQNEHESKVLPLITKVESTTESIVEPIESEQMTLESVTLHSVKTLVESLKSDELLQTKSILDEKAGKQVEELMLVQTGTGTELAAVAEDESETLTKALSQWDSLSEDLQELEGEAGSLVTELLCHVPAAISKPPPTTANRSSASDRPSAVNEDSLQEEEEVNVEEALTLESITLAEVKAEVGGLETEVLQEANNVLEKKADELVKEEKMELRMETEEDVVFEDTTEAEILSLDSISEATEAIEAETSVILEAMFGSEQGVSQHPDTLRVPQSEMIHQEVEKESGEQEGNIVEAMSLESVTLAEVEASLGTLENECLSKTAAFLENEADVLAIETRMEVEELPTSDDQIEDLSVESPALPEDLQTDKLMEELLFTVPGPAAEIQRPVGAQTLDATVTSEPAVVDTAATDTNDVPASPAPKEVLLGQEVVEDGAQTEASENEGTTGTHSDLDPIQRLFLEKIREYNNMHRLGGRPVEAGSEYERYLSEETAKLQRQYGGGDLSRFPQFTFTEPKMDEDSK